MTIYIAIKAEQLHASRSKKGLAELIGVSRTGIQKAFNKGKIKGYKLHITSVAPLKPRGKPGFKFTTPSSV